MSPGATALVPSSSLDEDAWDDLISYIEERRVIPIIGPELLLVQTDQGPRLLHDWFAGKLALRLNVDVTQLPQPYTLNDVVCWFLGARGRREEACVRLRGILKDAAFEPPLALRQLAAIPEFDLFVTTSFDALLENAINQERFGGPGQAGRVPARHRGGRETAPRPGEPQSRRPEPESRDGGRAVCASAQ
jgi:hypothetical protein